MRRNITDLAIVLSRVDYQEKDRIITVLTENHGKLRAIARSVRSSKSRLAGGIELFAENELGLAEGRGELHTLTHSRMKRYFGNIAKDTEATMYAYECLKTVGKLTPENAGEEYYDDLVRLLTALDAHRIPLDQIRIWYGLKLLKTLGASPNLTTGPQGKPLSEGGRYQYDFDKHCFYTKPDGPYRADHIKLLRHLSRAGKPVEVMRLDDEITGSLQRLTSLLVSSHIK
ncbi:MAG TPA: DNA repair protein RecO [Candidatus Saccharimonadales bacterium]|nr:DNA repair protein RecO [Candidatus Saccharimonadales bacterium]